MIFFVNEDLFKSKAEIIAHQCNCKGEWGASGGENNVALQMRNNFGEDIYKRYADFCHEFDGHTDKLLGTCQIIEVEPSHKYIANLFAQDDFNMQTDGKLYTNYKALHKALLHLLEYLWDYYNAHGKILSVAIPHNMGCGKGGGSWETTCLLISSVFDECLFKVYICKREVE